MRETDMAMGTTETEATKWAETTTEKNTKKWEREEKQEEDRIVELRQETTVETSTTTSTTLTSSTNNNNTVDMEAEETTTTTNPEGQTYRSQKDVTTTRAKMTDPRPVFTQRETFADMLATLPRRRSTRSRASQKAALAASVAAAAKAAKATRRTPSPAEWLSMADEDWRREQMAGRTMSKVICRRTWWSRSGPCLQGRADTVCDTHSCNRLTGAVDLTPKNCVDIHTETEGPCGRSWDCYCEPDRPWDHTKQFSFHPSVKPRVVYRPTLPLPTTRPPTPSTTTATPPPPPPTPPTTFMQPETISGIRTSDQLTTATPEAGATPNGHDDGGAVINITKTNATEDEQVEIPAIVHVAGANHWRTLVLVTLALLTTGGLCYGCYRGLRKWKIMGPRGYRRTGHVEAGERNIFTGPQERMAMTMSNLLRQERRQQQQEEDAEAAAAITGAYRAQQDVAEGVGAASVTTSAVTTTTTTETAIITTAAADIISETETETRPTVEQKH